jgi:gamma-glutamylcyclotransferase (GGCT)/AIG2-like uncharacterized protein YtfP
MNLLANKPMSGHITEAIVHFNYALDLKYRHSSSVDVAQAMFNALNKLQTEWLMNQSEQQIGEVKAFQAMILSGLPLQSRDAFLQTTQTRSIVTLEPKILNHDTLRRGGYKPDVPVDPRLAKDASEAHRKLETAYRDLEQVGTDEVSERVIKRLAELLYVVRSNIAHGEKTLYGPDLNKRERDEQVCACAVPLQELLLDMLFGLPSRKLISYGTLAPGQPNHSLISDLIGEWEECVIRGTMSQRDGLSRFSWNPNGSEQIANIFSSDNLPNNWDRIDRFEGAGYRRQLIPTRTQAGIAIGYAYVNV